MQAVEFFDGEDIDEIEQHMNAFLSIKNYEIIDIAYRNCVIPDDHEDILWHNVMVRYKVPGSEQEEFKQIHQEYKYWE
jgi:transposase-like protein